MHIWLPLIERERPFRWSVRLEARGRSPVLNRVRSGQMRKGVFMNDSSGARVLTRETLLREGLSLKVLAITVILMLSVGVVVMGYPAWPETGLLGEMLESQRETLVGFAFLMLLTVGYLVGKGWATTRYQGVLIERL